MTPTFKTSATSSRLVYSLFSVLSACLSHVRRSYYGSDAQSLEHYLTKREEEVTETERILFPILIPVLVLLSVELLRLLLWSIFLSFSKGLFAGLTLGYFSLELTTLNVLSGESNTCPLLSYLTVLAVQLVVLRKSIWCQL